MQEDVDKEYLNQLQDNHHNELYTNLWDWNGDSQYAQGSEQCHSKATAYYL